MREIPLHGARTWTTNQRRLASCLVFAHLAAVFIAPWSSPPPAPLLAETMARWFSPYQSAAYLNHGYRFFAPDPGPSHIVRYELVRSDGSTVTGQIPDPVAHRPRLLYHRFFMITETLYNTWSRIETAPAETPIPPEELERLKRRNEFTQQLVQQLAKGLAHQLLLRERGRSVRLTLQEHAIPFPEDVEAGRPLNDPSLYTALADLGEFRSDE
jgi:hypothetical protein